MKKILFIFIVLSSLSYSQGTNTLVTKAELDSALATFYTYTITKQMIVRNDTLIFSDTLSNTLKFDTTAFSDSVAIATFDTNDVVIVTPLDSVYNAHDILFIKKYQGYFKVFRDTTGTTSGLSWSYIWIKRY